MAATEEKRFVIYSRKSRFTGKGESIENQIELCRQYIATHYGEAEAKAALVYEDEGFSGGTLERPQFKRMMEESYRTQFTAIVVYRLDRISRNIGDFAKLIDDLSHREISFISIKEQFDTSSPMGRAMMYIASVFLSWNGKQLQSVSVIICTNCPRLVAGWGAPPRQAMPLKRFPV